jgi:5-methylthioadenosine/S-adenosylhomocysteine deaminase
MRQRITLVLSIVLVASGLTVPSGAAPRSQADLIIVAAHVLSMDADARHWTPGAVAIRGDAIVAAGPAAEVQASWRSKNRYDAGNAVVMPGFINTHCHLPMVMLRGVADDLELMEWLNGYIFPLEAELVDARFCYEASLVVCAELIRRGFTSVVDMYYFEDEIARAVSQAGMRGWLGQTIIDFPAPDFGTPAESLAATELWMSKWAPDPLVEIIPAPHSCYTVSPENLQSAKQLADRRGSMMTLHLSESNNEVATVTDRYGKRPVQHAAALGVLGSNVLAAHCVQLSDADMDTLAATDTAVTHNPDSNLKLASGISPVAKLTSMGVRVGLGTDGPVSNNRLDPFHTMDLVAKLQKVREDDAAVMKAREVVRMGTIGGAECLGASQTIGSLEPGKRADLIVIDLDFANYGPVYDIYSHLVYAAHGEMVESTMVNGRWLMRDGKLVTLDEGRLRRIVTRRARQVERIVDGRAE